MGSRKKESLFWIEAAFIVLLMAGAYVVGSYAKAVNDEALQEVFISDHGENIVEVKDEQGLVIESHAVDYDELIDGYKNILVVGVDAREQSNLSSGANADVIMIASINKENGTIRLVSILRDTLLRIEDPGIYHPDRSYDKANSQICYTGIADMISMINKNLDLNIQDYIVLNWLSAAKVIDTIGGVEVTIDDPEIVRYMNGYLTEVNEKTGIWSKQLEGTGTFNLTGTQAVAFCRVRYAGLGDVGRTKNQRMMIEQCLKKVKGMIVSKPGKVIEAVTIGMESISTNMSMLELGNLIFQAGNFQIEESVSFPFEYTTGEYVGDIYEETNGVKDAVVAKELKDNVIKLHSYLFPDAAYAYQLPDAVINISEDIAVMSGVRRQSAD